MLEKVILTLIDILFCALKQSTTSSTVRCSLLPPSTLYFIRKATVCLHSFIPIRADSFAVGMVIDMKDRIQRISVWKEWLVLTRQFLLILFSDKKNLVISLAFPVVAAFITVWIAGENMFVHYEGTKSACFVLVSAAIWGGLFNSIQIIVRERQNIRRDYAAGLRLRSYIASRACVQIVFCALESLLLSCALPGVRLRFDNQLPASGLIIGSAFWEYYISLFMLMCAADAMGVCISCLVKKEESANVVAPYILIVQLIFSGILFAMKGGAEKLSYVMLSRWGMEALGCTSDLNSMPLKIQSTVPAVPHEVEDMFLCEPEHLLRVWLVLTAFTAVFFVTGGLFLRLVAKDAK